MLRWIACKVAIVAAWTAAEVLGFVLGVLGVRQVESMEEHGEV